LHILRVSIILSCSTVLYYVHVNAQQLRLNTVNYQDLGLIIMLIGEP